jgi:DNA-binding winged helix-turn-helix (wHTH) protein
MKLLCLLAEAEGAAVERGTLVATLWPRAFVNEEARSQAIADHNKRRRKAEKQAKSES